MSALPDILDVERIEDDVYRGRTAATTLQRTFGGQVAGQALVAATRTAGAAPTGEPLSVHSLHGYFLRPGDPGLATVYVVDRVRDGRSFATRRVTGVQHGQAIFSMSASFSVLDDGPEHQDPMPDVTPPEQLEDAAETDRAFHEVHRTEWPDWDVRRTAPGRFDGRAGAASSQQVWLRHREPLPDDPVLHACALAYASDLTLLGCARLPHVDGPPMQGASLDHALWFLRPFRADEWLLYDQTSPSAARGRGLTQGRIFDRSGRLVAAAVQEGLMRWAPDRG